MAVNDAHVFPGFLTPVPTQLFFPKPPTTFLTCFCRGERRKYAGKKIRLNRGSNSQPPGHESGTLTTKPPRRGLKKGEITWNKQFSLFSQCFLPYMALIFYFKCTFKCCMKFVSILDQSKILLSGNGSTCFQIKIFYPEPKFRKSKLKGVITFCKCIDSFCKWPSFRLNLQTTKKKCLWKTEIGLRKVWNHCETRGPW